MYYHAQFTLTLAVRAGQVEGALPSTCPSSTMWISNTAHKADLCYVWPEYTNFCDRLFKKLMWWDCESVHLNDHQCAPASRAPVATLSIRAHQAYDLVDKDGDMAGSCERTKFGMMFSQRWLGYPAAGSARSSRPGHT